SVVVHDPHLAHVLVPSPAPHLSLSAPIPAASAPSAPAGIDVRLLVQHHIDQQAVAHVALIGWAEVLEEAVTLPDVGHHLFGLRNHFQRQIVANGDALSVAFALAGVDHDVEHAAFALLFGRTLVILTGLGPLLGEHLAIGRIGDGFHLLL